MAKLTTSAFRTHVSQQILESITEVAPSTYYVFVSQSRSWPNDSIPPSPIDNPSNQAISYDKMVFGKRVTVDDARHMTIRYDWTANTIYDMYDDSDPNLKGKKFFVTVAANTEFHVFKCLFNNGNKPSTIEPAREDTSESDTFYQTSDGYQWKYLYSLESSTFRKFATSQWIPVEPNANTTGNATPGVIDVILVTAPGTKYNSYTNGFFQVISADANGNFSFCTIDSTASANADFYKDCAIKITAGPGAGQQRVITQYTVSGGQKVVYLDNPWNSTNPPNISSKYEITPNITIIGDGVDAQARALVNASSNSIYSVEITDRGTAYTYATASVTGNTGQINAISNTFIANNATLRVIIGPPYGHGGSVAEELCASALGFSVTLANTENGTVPDVGSFRQLGLMRDPLYANVIVTLTGITGTFAADESIMVHGTSLGGTSVSYDSGTSTLFLTNVSGAFAANVMVVGGTSNASATVSNVMVNGSAKDFLTFDQRTRMGVTFNGTPVFNSLDFITQNITGANGYVHEANDSFVALVETQGVFNTNDLSTPNPITTSTSSANVNSIIHPDILKGSGQLLYIENVPPITRGQFLSETLKFIIEF